MNKSVELLITVGVPIVCGLVGWNATDIIQRERRRNEDKLKQELAVNSIMLSLSELKNSVSSMRIENQEWEKVIMTLERRLTLIEARSNTIDIKQ